MIQMFSVDWKKYVNDSYVAPEDGKPGVQRDLKDFWELVNISVHESTIRRSFNKGSVSGRTPQKSVQQTVQGTDQTKVKSLRYLSTFNQVLYYSKILSYLHFTSTI